MNYNLFYLENGAQKYSGIVNDSVSFTLKSQLKDKELWRKFVKVFSEKRDSIDKGWRGEYFGKMMRGACITYKYHPDEELYVILYDTVKNLLKTQDDLGRITTYSVESEFNGWDMWVRKYVIVGCLYFYEICRDERFKAEIIEALCRHVDYLISKIGDENGKISILDTSSRYGGLNSSSILEPVVELYKVTNTKCYLDFAKYILTSGGCKSGNLIELALEGKKMPFQYPEVKAYEMMSFFEGALAYYEVTGEEKYFNAVSAFADAVLKSDITVIGSAGCTHELFDNSALKQAKEVPDGTIMQETCVTVTWIRLQERLLRLTGKETYASNIEKSVYNALNGSLNIFDNQQFSREEKKYLPGVTFDSYSPLVFQPRGIGIGGFKKFSDCSYYGCCTCIGAAGTGLFPLISVYRSEMGFIFNYYHTGTVKGITPSGQQAVFHMRGEASTEGKCTITVIIPHSENFCMAFRVPEWSDDHTIYINGEKIQTKHGYCTEEREWKSGDIIEIETPAEIRFVTLCGKTSFSFGAFTLARDEAKEAIDISKPFTPILEKGKLVYKRLPAEIGEAVRFVLSTEEGEVLLTDYASCGKHWTEKPNKISAWLNVKQ